MFCRTKLCYELMIMLAVTSSLLSFVRHCIPIKSNGVLMQRVYLRHYKKLTVLLTRLKNNNMETKEQSALHSQKDNNNEQSTIFDIDTDHKKELNPDNQNDLISGTFLHSDTVKTTDLFDDASTGNFQQIPSTSTKREGLIPNQLLNKVTSIIKNKVQNDPTGILCDNVIDQSQIKDTYEGVKPNKGSRYSKHGKFSSSSRDDSPSDETYDLSALFSDTFDEAYKINEKRSRKKPKKRKCESTGTDEQDNKQKKVKQNRPNYFLAIQVDSPMVHQNIEIVQKYMLTVNPELKKATIPVPTLHLTLMVMYLEGEDQIQKAVHTLEKCKEQLSEKLKFPLILEIGGIKNFRDEVIFANTNNIDRLEEVADAVSTVFTEEGITASDNKGFKPHITILKLSKAPKLRKKGIKKVGVSHYDPYKDSIFGRQLVTGVQLCAMLKPKSKDGYYHVEHAISCVPNGNEGPASLNENINLLELHTPKLTASVHERQNFHVEFEKEIKWSFREPDDATENDSND